MTENDEILELEEFDSVDGNHHVIWATKDHYSYPVWWCETHNEPYFKYCIETFEEFLFRTDDPTSGLNEGY